MNGYKKYQKHRFWWRQHRIKIFACQLTSQFFSNSNYGFHLVGPKGHNENCCQFLVFFLDIYGLMERFIGCCHAFSTEIYPMVWRSGL